MVSSVPKGQKAYPIVGEYVGRPEGPLLFVESLGQEVGTFIDPRTDLLPRNVKTTLMYHVPLDMRGPYKGSPNGEDVNEKGDARCLGYSEGTNKECGARAMHRSGYCAQHGGALHPLDKKIIDWDAQPRWARFKYGKLPVEELDDEEISRGQIRNEDGSWTNNTMVSKEIHDHMVRELFKRSDDQLKRNLLAAVEGMTDIAKGSAYEPADRIKAAAWIWEKLRGKTPDVVIHQQEKPYEMIMTHIAGGSRAESRAARGVATDEELAQLNDFIDAEVTEVNNIEPEPDYVDDAVIDYESHVVKEEPAFLYHGPIGKPITDPPVDPDLRVKYEKAQAEKREEKRLADIAAKKELAENIRKARNKRFSAQSRGFETVEDLPYTVSSKKGKKGYAITFSEVEDKTPPGLLAKETKRRRRDHE